MEGLILLKKKEDFAIRIQIIREKIKYFKDFKEFQILCSEEEKYIKEYD